MTSDKSRKRDIRRRMQQHNEPYAEAARRLAEQDAPPILADDVPAARVPAPVAMMLARHLDAATHHIGRAERLARGHGVSAFAEGDSLRDKPSGPLAEIADAATYDLHRLVDWAGRTAHESGAVPAVPSPWGDATPSQRQAYEILYPERHHWCASPGGVLPGPGERPRDDNGRMVTHSLPGPVTGDRLSLRASGQSVVRVGDVAPGTPAAPIWDAAERLERYACEWMNRGGDSPADLAAALDGLEEVAERLQSVLGSVTAEIERRYADGCLEGGDHVGLAAQGGQADEAARTLHRRIYAMRHAMTGAAAALPPARPGTVPPHIAGPMDGKTLAEVRAELGDEVFMQRQVGKTRPGDDRQTTALARILTWMHVKGASVYDAPAHAKTDAAARLTG